MEFAYAIRQMSGVRELYECAQRMEPWLPPIVEGLSRFVGRSPAVEPRFIVLHDAESAQWVHKAVLPVWTEPEQGLIHLCPHISVWKGLLQGWAGSLPAPGDDALWVERFARSWTLRFLTCVMVGQGAAKHYEPLFSLPRSGPHAWLRHGLALAMGRLLWESAEPYLNDDAAACERWVVECRPAAPSLETSFSSQLPLGEQWPSWFRAASAARDLASILGGWPVLLKALTGSFAGKRPGTGREPYVKLFGKAGLNEEAAMEFLRRWNIAPDEAA